MVYATNENRVIKTSKELKTTHKPSEQERRIREFCRNHNSSTEVNQDVSETYIIRSTTADEWWCLTFRCPACECCWMMASNEDLHFCPKCGRRLKLKNKGE